MSALANLEKRIKALEDAQGIDPDQTLAQLYAAEAKEAKKASNAAYRRSLRGEECASREALDKTIKDAPLIVAKSIDDSDARELFTQLQKTVLSTFKKKYQNHSHSTYLIDTYSKEFYYFDWYETESPLFEMDVSTLSNASLPFILIPDGKDDSSATTCLTLQDTSKWDTVVRAWIDAEQEPR